MTRSSAPPAMTPSPVRISSVRSPAVPIASRTFRRPATARDTSMSPARPASLCAKSMTTKMPSRSNRFRRPGLAAESWAKERRPLVIRAADSPSASHAAAAASAFAMLKRERPATVTGSSDAGARGRGRRPAARSTSMSPSSTAARPPSSRTRSTRPELDSRLNAYRCARVRRCIAHARSSSALRTAHPSRFVMRTIVPFTSASSSTVSIPCSPRWSAVTFVTTLTSFSAYPIPRSRIPPRAVSSTARSRPGSARTRPAPPKPDQSPASTSSPRT